MTDKLLISRAAVEQALDLLVRLKHLLALEKDNESIIALRSALDRNDEATDMVVPEGYALISTDSLKAWGKHDEVKSACLYPFAEPVNPTVNQVLTVDISERIADCLIEDHVALMAENDGLRQTLGAKQAEIDRLMLEYCPGEMTPEQTAKFAANQKPITEAWHGQSNINNRFNACHHKEYCCQLKERVESIDASAKPVEETPKSVHVGSTNSCQNSTKLVETEQSQSADLSSKTPTAHRYTGSFGE